MCFYTFNVALECDPDMLFRCSKSVNPSTKLCLHPNAHPTTTRFPSVSSCRAVWQTRRQSESSLPVPFPTLCFTCEYPACIRWLWVGEPRANLRLYAQLCRRTVFARHPRARITSAQAINTESQIINPVLQGHRRTHTPILYMCVQTNRG